MTAEGLFIRQLRGVAESAGHRYLLVLVGDDDWLDGIQAEIYQISAGRRVLYVGEASQDGVLATSQSHARRWLGREVDLVIMDGRCGIHADAIGAVAGIIQGGGLFVLLLPKKTDEEHLLQPGFYSYLLTATRHDPACVLVRQGEALPCLPVISHVSNTEQQTTAPYVSLEQKNAVEQIVSTGKQNSPGVLVLTSDRGRGKSSSLGIAAAQLLQQGYRRIIITAPRYAASEKVFEHAQRILADAKFQRGTLQTGEAQLLFNAPDQLLEELPEVDVLLVDEAAAIPVPMLTQMLQHYVKIVFATTVHGYEGTGRGFALRFYKVLDQQRPGWIKQEIRAPARWAANDPLEKWLFKVLCLDAEIADESSLESIDISSLQYREVNKQALYENNDLLRQVFALLVLAHYRTRPSDLQHLLDDESLSLYIAVNNSTLLAVCLVMREGSFEPSLAGAIYRGKRRPQGHLLAQTLTYHCGCEQAATLDVARIMRIAVHPSLQSRSIGSQLLQYVVEQEKGRQRDLIGTSFGATPELIRFWQQAGFNTVRLGFTREHSSGEHAAVMVKPLSESGEEVFTEVRTRFIEQWHYWLNDPLRHLPAPIINSLAISHMDDTDILNEAEHKDLQSYIDYQRSYEICLAAIVKFARRCFADIKVKDMLTTEEQQLLQSKVLDGKGWQEVVSITGLSGKNEVREKLKAVIAKLYQAGILQI